jgi:hypothetical protein
VTRSVQAIAALLVILGISRRVTAQENPAPVRSTFWGFVALGVGAVGDSSFYAAGVGAAWQRRNLVLMSRIASVGPEKENRMEDLGLLAGVGTQRGRFHYLAAAGLGVARTSQDSTALALPIEAHATWRFSRVAGIGLRGFLSLNKLATFGGLTVMAQVGRLR